MEGCARAAGPAAGVPVAAQARVITAETVLPPGQSGFVPPEWQPENRT
jgi:hypothetical protein